MTFETEIKSIDDAVSIAYISDRFPYDVDCVYDRYIVDAKSIMGLVSMGYPKKVNLIIHTDNIAVVKDFENKIKFRGEKYESRNY